MTELRLQLLDDEINFGLGRFALKSRFTKLVSSPNHCRPVPIQHEDESPVACLRDDYALTLAHHAFVEHQVSSPRRDYSIG